MTSAFVWGLRFMVSQNLLAKQGPFRQNLVQGQKLSSVKNTYLFFFLPNTWPSCRHMTLYVDDVAKSSHIVPHLSG